MPVMQRVGNLHALRRSVYGIVFIAGINFVALFWTFSRRGNIIIVLRSAFNRCRYRRTG